MSYVFQYRQLNNHTDNHMLPLKKGKYTMRNEFYECDRAPQIGETCSAFIEYALWCGKLIRTSFETYMID